MAGAYKSGVAIRESRLTTKITDVTDSAQSSIINSFYVHSKVRNYYNNKRYVDISSLAKIIDQKLTTDFEKAIKQSEQQEERIYKSLRIDSAREMQDIFDLNIFQTRFNDKFSFYNMLQEAVDTYVSTDGAKTITMNQLRDNLENVANDIRLAYTDMLYEYRERIIGTKDQSGSDIIIASMDVSLQRILDSLSGDQEIELSELLKTPGRFIKNISQWQGITGEVQQYIAGLENEYIDAVIGELTQGIGKKKEKTDVSWVVNKRVQVNLSVKNYRPPKDTQKFMDISVHDGQKLSEFIKSIAKINGGGKTAVINYFTYNLVNILAFTRSGGVQPGNVNRVDKHSESEFSEYQDFINIIKKTAAYWLGFKTMDKSNRQSFTQVNFLVINGTIIPMSEILKNLKDELLTGASKMRSSLTNVPQFGPTVLWEDKYQVIQTLSDDYYSQGKRNYPAPLIQVGASVGQMIAEQTKVNVQLSIAVERLIRR